MAAQIQITDLSNILKKVIAPTIQEELATATLLLDKIQRNVGITHMPNNEWYISGRTGR